jgi:methylthioribose-1-phosphate isomerase
MLPLTTANWCKCFTDIADLHAPIKKMKVKGVNIPWMTAELSQAMQQRDHHLKKAQKNSQKYTGLHTANTAAS